MAAGRLTPRTDGLIEVTLTKDLRGDKAERFGFANLPSVDGRSLQVSWVDANGLLGRWNRGNPDKAVREGDLIVSVNGLSENLEGMQAQLQQNSIRMLIKSTTGTFASFAPRS